MNKFIYFLLLLIVSCSSDPITEEVTSFRKGKNQQFIAFEDSPIPVFKRTYFKGLNYYEPSSKGIIDAVFTKEENPDSIDFVINENKSVIYLKVGKIAFEMEGKSFELTAFKNGKSESSLFIPFSDNTSGLETYGAGRYLYASISNEQEVKLDFNYASNPYCAYEESYICFPAPEENHLDLRIEFGEKNYH
jgi:uncharacterized protein